jgi:type II secretion system protein J
MYLKKAGFTPLDILVEGKKGTSAALYLTGFTLVEVLVASTIGAFIALVAVGALRAITASAEMVDNNISTAAEIRFASNIIARDLINIYHDPNNQNVKFIGMVEDSEQGGLSYLVFYTVSRTRARIGQPEGDVYEVEYYLRRNDENSVIMRRYWPNPDQEETEPRGILTVLAENIDVFQIRYFDGEDWSYEWPEEMEVLPQLIEVTIATRQPGQEKQAVENFIVNFARSASVTGIVTDSGEQTQTTAEDAEQGGQGGNMDMSGSAR